MSRKRFIVTGYMARCPIAGVIWQHIHYIVGLQRLGHEVYYIEDSTAHPYHPITYDYVPDWSYTAEIMPKGAYGRCRFRLGSRSAYGGWWRWSI